MRLKGQSGIRLRVVLALYVACGEPSPKDAVGPSVDGETSTPQQVAEASQELSRTTRWIALRGVKAGRADQAGTESSEEDLALLGEPTFPLLQQTMNNDAGGEAVESSLAASQPER